MADKKKNENRRYIGKIKEISGEYGDFHKFVVDNPNPKTEDGAANKYYKGSLMWRDANGELFIVKSMSLRGVSERDESNGFINSVSIDLDNKYDVKKVNSKK